jgi:hypothetical protein
MRKEKMYKYPGINGTIYSAVLLEDAYFIPYFVFLYTENIPFLVFLYAENIPFSVFLYAENIPFLLKHA